MSTSKDASSGSFVTPAVAHVGIVDSPTHSTATTHRYVAEVDNAGGANIQANSAPVTITWG